MTDDRKRPSSTPLSERVPQSHAEKFEALALRVARLTLPPICNDPGALASIVADARALTGESEPPRGVGHDLYAAPTSDLYGNKRVRLLLWVKGHGWAFGYVYEAQDERIVGIEGYNGDWEVLAWASLPESVE